MDEKKKKTNQLQNENIPPQNFFSRKFQKVQLSHMPATIYTAFTLYLQLFTAFTFIKY